MGVGGQAQQIDYFKNYLYVLSWQYYQIAAPQLPHEWGIQHYQTRTASIYFNTFLLKFRASHR